MRGRGSSLEMKFPRGPSSAESPHGTEDNLEPQETPSSGFVKNRQRFAGREIFGNRGALLQGSCCASTILPQLMLP